MFGKKKKTQKSSIEDLMAQIERTKKINNDMLAMSMNFTKQTDRRLKEVKR